MSFDIFSLFTTDFTQRFVLPYTLMVLPFYVWYGLLFFLKNKYLTEEDKPKTNLSKLALKVLLYTYLLPIVIALFFFFNNYHALFYFSEFVDKQTSKSEMTFHLWNLLGSIIISFLAALAVIFQYEGVKTFSEIKQAKGKIFTKLYLFTVLFSIPFMYILFELFLRLSFIEIIVFIGLPGALIYFIMRG